MKRMIAVLALAAAAWAMLHAGSPRVRRWRPGAGVRRRSGALSARVFGSGDEVVLLIPGIAASGTFFGADFNRLGDAATVVVVDPLGFGDSMPDSRNGVPVVFTLDSHLDALDSLLADLRLSARPLTVAGHSMGGALAIHLGARRPSVTRVIALDAPLFLSHSEAIERVQGMGWFEALLSTGPLAERVCAWMCRHRRVAAMLSVLLNPALPAAIARDGVRHTWPAYSGAFDAIVTSTDWIGALDTLESRGTPVFLIDGADDPVPAPGRAAALAAQHSQVCASTHPGRHDLPLRHPEWTANEIARLLRG